ncbi:hypothetical protein X474_27350 [Dethiosulfatarculus sandiegensis]|uniref:Uncharacterized protein n=1 Tax=Dethiosulfatarculus sandiegensis TaxID=1429043 RepID=A0A0D2HK78_9BACT|nr:hypothetical protein X474_27350 [Dethiosulfatarculus sandiegensis]
MDEKVSPTYLAVSEARVEKPQPEANARTEIRARQINNLKISDGLRRGDIDNAPHI